MRWPTLPPFRLGAIHDCRQRYLAHQTRGDTVLNLGRWFKRAAGRAESLTRSSSGGRYAKLATATCRFSAQDCR